jgi:hypothetical protein
MALRHAAAAGLALGIFGLPVPPRAPVTTKYRIESKNETTVDLSAFGQPPQQINIGLTTWVRVTLSDTTGGRVVQVVVDSMKYDGAAPVVSQATADSAKGGSVHGLVDPAGRVKNISQQPSSNAFLTDIQGVIHSFFPRVKSGAKTGDGWSDTVEVTNTTNGANLTSKFLINYTAAGTEQFAGAAALKLTASSSATVGGTIENPQAGTLEVEGKISGTSTSLVGGDGRYLGGSSNSTSEQNMKSPMFPSPIPVKVIRTVTVTLLP